MNKEKLKEQLQNYEMFLESLKMWPGSKNIRVKEVEDIQFKGVLNPTNDLYKKIFVEGQFINFEDFFKYYCSQHRNELNELYKRSNINKDTFKIGVKARMYRTQFTILTEYDAYLLSRIIFDTVIIDPELDKIGVDFQIIYPNQKYNIHVYVNTQLGRKYREIKINQRHSNDVAGIHIDLPYSLSDNDIHSARRLKNGFGVFTEKYLTYLKNEIESGAIKNKKIIRLGSTGFIYKET